MDIDWIYLVLAAALVVFILALVLRYQGRSRSIRVFDASGGSVLISAEALEALVTSTCLLVEEVRSARARLVCNGEKVNVEVRLHLNNHANLKDTLITVQSFIRESVQRNLGMRNLATVDLKVSHLSGPPVRDPLRLDGPVEIEPSEAFGNGPHETVVSLEKEKK